MDQLVVHIHEQLTIDPWRIPIVVASGVGTYLGFLLLVRLFGSRVLSKMHSFDAVVLIMFGAVAGRTILGHPPTLLAGLIGLATLMVMEAVFGVVRNMRSLRRALNGSPQVLVAHGRVIAEQLRKTHTSIADISVAARAKGVRDFSDVELMILESTGEISLYTQGTAIDPLLLEGVKGLGYYFSGEDRVH